jgi:GT2 family glycosyltransferase
MMSDTIGVVIIGRNEGERLISCLASVKFDTDNVVYVDSGSTDGSVSAAEQMGTFVVTLNSGQPFTAARARNEGFAALKVLLPNIRFVQFVDGDCILVHGWLDEALAFLEQRKDVAIVCGRRRERHPNASVYNQLCDLEWDTPIGEASACGGDALVRVEAFEAASGFRPRLIAGEEPELCLRLREKGWKIWRLDLEMTQHDMAMTRFSQWWVRTVRSGYGISEVARLHKNSEFRIWRRATASAIIWGGVVPAIIGLGTIIHPAVLTGMLIYFLQIGRIAIRRGYTSSRSWIFAFFVTLAKFAEFQGFLKFCWRSWRGENVQLIEYK